MWKYNRKIYKSRREMKELFGWSTCKLNSKIKDGKIIKLTNEDARLNENLHNNPDRSE